MASVRARRPGMVHSLSTGVGYGFVGNALNGAMALKLRAHDNHSLHVDVLALRPFVAI